MTSEHFVFDKGGKDQTARRALFSTFVNLFLPDWSEDGDCDCSIEDHMCGFRKSAGIWYQNGNKIKSWDRRLVFWMRAGRIGYLPFYEPNGELVTAYGHPLTEAAICTLEVVLRNQAMYTVGFLLIPKYKKNQVQCISEASSWLVIAFFPFPKSSGLPILRIDGCVTDERRIWDILNSNLHNAHPEKDGCKRSDRMVEKSKKGKRRNIHMSGEMMLSSFQNTDVPVKEEQNSDVPIKRENDNFSCAASSKMDDQESKAEDFFDNNMIDFDDRCRSVNDVIEGKKLDDDTYPIPVPWGEDDTYHTLFENSDPFMNSGYNSPLPDFFVNSANSRSPALFPVNGMESMPDFFTNTSCDSAGSPPAAAAPPPAAAAAAAAAVPASEFLFPPFDEEIPELRIGEGRFYWEPPDQDKQNF